MRKRYVIINHFDFDNSDINNGNKLNVSTVEDYILHDNTRGREIPVRIYYPNLTRKMTSRQYISWISGSKDALSYIGEYWASQGHICIHPTHIGRCFYFSRK